MMDRLDELIQKWRMMANNLRAEYLSGREDKMASAFDECANELEEALKHERWEAEERATDKDLEMLEMLEKRDAQE